MAAERSTRSEEPSLPEVVQQLVEEPVQQPVEASAQESIPKAKVAASSMAPGSAHWSSSIRLAALEPYHVHLPDHYFPPSADHSC